MKKKKKKRERETDRQTDRDTERGRDLHAGTELLSERDRQTDRQTETETERGGETSMLALNCCTYIKLIIKTNVNHRLAGR